MQIFESVPNISEAKDQNKINILLGVVCSFSDVELLDYSSDIDHNRSVFTFIGTKNGIIEANFKLLQKAQEILNINDHQGIHPRVGVVDVMPIIPVLNANMDDAVVIADELGKKIETELKIPVYYYESAAKEKKYANLANIRREKYNIVAHKTAGTVCIGARGFLIAYNINLASKNLEIAKKIAAKVRESGGGLPYVKALGLYLDHKNCAQVSMNLTNPLVTDKKTVYEAIKAIATRYDIEIKEEELIGMLPENVIAAAKNFEKEKNADIKKNKRLIT